MAKKATKEEAPAEKTTGFTKQMKLSTDLGAIVGKKEASRDVIKELCSYLKKSLQDLENKQ